MSMRGEENSRKNDDCYFYYYSTCLKGDYCLFRHEKNALGCEVVCQYWKEGKCLNERCNYRHMELKKNRKVIPCYWETQPSGCRKPHCPFRHVLQKDKPPDKVKEAEAATGSNAVVASSTAAVENVTGSASSRSSNAAETGPVVMGGQAVPLRGDLNYTNPSVDRVVVKFEEESDNESVPSSLSPQKRVSSPKTVSSPELMRVKTLEEIRLERVQKQSAAYYGMQEDFEKEYMPSRRVKLISRAGRSEGLSLHSERHSRKRTYSDYKVLTLEEIRKNRESRKAGLITSSETDNYRSDDENKKTKTSSIVKCLPDSTSETELKEDENDQVADTNIDGKIPDVKDCISDTCVEPSDTVLQFENCNSDDADEKLRNLKLESKRPIKLRRFTRKRAHDDFCTVAVVRNKAKLKRTRPADGDSTVSNSNSGIESNNTDFNSPSSLCVKNGTDDCTSANIDDSLSVLSSSSLPDDLPSDDILRDIDDMLND